MYKEIENIKQWPIPFQAKVNPFKWVTWADKKTNKPFTSKDIKVQLI